MEETKGQKIEYFIYARKSSESDEKQVQSIDDQIRAMEEIGRREGLKIVGVYKEAKSAKEPDRRKEYTRMRQDIKKGVARGILSWKLDRLARNPDEAGQILGMMQRGEIQHIKTNDRDYRPEDNALISYVEFGMADQYSRDLSKNVKRGQKSKLEKGWQPGSAPPGYLNSKVKARGENDISSDPASFPLIRQAWDLMLTGEYVPPQILDKLNNEWGFRTRKTAKKGGKPMSRSTLYRIFTNPFYAGWISYQIGGRGKKRQDELLLMPGKHEKMVTQEEFEKVQLLLRGTEGKPHPKRHEYAYPGMIRCGECGGLISPTYKGKILKGTGKLVEYSLYYCINARKGLGCSQGLYTNANIIDNQIAADIERYTIAPEFKDWALAVLRQQNDKEIEERTKVHEMRHKAVRDAQKQLDNLTRMRLQEQVNDAEYDRERTRLKNEILVLQAKVAETEERAANWVELTEKAFVFACEARDAFLRGNAEIKRAILKAIGLNWRLKDHELRIEAKEWLIPIAEKKDLVQDEIHAFEHVKNIKNIQDLQGQQWINDPMLSGLRERRDSNPQPLP